MLKSMWFHILVYSGCFFYQKYNQGELLVFLFPFLFNKPAADVALAI